MPPDPTARFYTHVWPHRATVLRTAQFLTRNSTEADDLAQETMMKAFRSIATFHDGTDSKGWLMTILRNTRIDRLRSTARSQTNISLDDTELDLPAAAEFPETPWDHPEEILEAFSDQQMIDALRNLPEEIRFTLLLVDVEGLEHVQAAEILQVPVGTIKSRAHRGRGMLRQQLQNPANSSAAKTIGGGT